MLSNEKVTFPSVTDAPKFAFYLADVLPLYFFFFFSNWDRMTNRAKIELSGKEGIRRLSVEEINVVFPRAFQAKHRKCR